MRRLDVQNHSKSIRSKVFVALAALVCMISLTAAFAQNPVGEPMVSGGDYEIGPEDVLEISVWKEKDLQREVLVRPDGWFTFPLVGNIEAKGKTAQQIQEEITQWLKEYIPNPVVSVSVKKIAGYKIFVIGRVNKPGEYVVGSYIDVLQALTLAGGLTPFAEEAKIKIVRKENGKKTILPFDYSTVKKGMRMEQNITLMCGDVIIVP
jgi:polysaccharide export outer membrane protein